MDSLIDSHAAMTADLWAWELNQSDCPLGPLYWQQPGSLNAVAHPFCPYHCRLQLANKPTQPLSNQLKWTGPGLGPLS